ncbi:MAG: ATP-binding cassette domain-containing protein [Myxococcota bacterium]
MIEVDGLFKQFPGPPVVTAVDGVSFTARAGEVLGLLGPNGAGKTTTLRMLVTLLTPDEGTVRVDGFDTRHAPDQVRAGIGYLSGSTQLYRRLTVREVLRYFGRLQGLSNVKDRVDQLIERFGLQEYANVRCERLSTGNTQRVNVARAVIHDPPVLVLDEPTAGLDVIAAQTVLEFVEEARGQGHCVVYSTHIMSEAERLCDRLVILHEGRALASGTLDTLREATGEHYLESIFLALVRRS